MYLEFNVINLYFALTGKLQTSTTLLVVFVSLSQSSGNTGGVLLSCFMHNKYHKQ